MWTLPKGAQKVYIALNLDEGRQTLVLLIVIGVY